MSLFQRRINLWLVFGNLIASLSPTITFSPLENVFFQRQRQWRVAFKAIVFVIVIDYRGHHLKGITSLCLNAVISQQNITDS